MPPPPKCCTVIVCENEIRDLDDAVRPCGAWMVVTRGEELPYCHTCKKQQRTWRLVTQQELDARDRQFLLAIERLGYLGLDGTGPPRPAGADH